LFIIFFIFSFQKKKQKQIKRYLSENDFEGKIPNEFGSLAKLLIL